MSWNPSKIAIWMLCGAFLFTGCTPSSPVYKYEGDLSYYIEEATRIDYPDVATATLDEVTQAHAPITVIDPDFLSFYDLSLEDCVGMALQNNKVFRGYGTPSLQGTRVAPGIDNLANGPAAAGTIYNVAIRETEPGFIGTPGQISGPGSITTNTGLEGNQGVEAALADFDAQFTSSLIWTNSDEPRNTIVTSPFNPLVFQQDQVQWQAEIAKKTANGTQIFFRNVNQYTDNNIPLEADGGFQNLGSWYRAALEFEVRQPLLRGRGAFIQRMPIVISRIGTDQELANLEAVLQNMVTNIEIRYWELYCAYRNLDAAKTGRDAALETWRIIDDQFQEGADVNKQQRAQAAEQYYFFSARVTEALNNLLSAEGNLRFLLGIASTDGRLIRPIDEAVMAPIEFDWCNSLCEALTYRPELRQERWEIKKRELSLAYAKNSLLPELNVTGLYRWLGLGNRFATSEGDLPFPAGEPGPADPFEVSGALNELYGGNYGEFQFGLDYRMPVGFRRELSNVRNAQLKLARELALLEDMELDVARELAESIRALAANQMIMQDAFNQWKETRIEEEHFLELKDAGVETLDVALDAQRRRSQAEQAFYAALCEYNKIIALIHRRKGTILAYSGVCMSEGPWAGKAYMDAEENARRRSASREIDYGWSRPGVISQGGIWPTNTNPGMPMAGERGLHISPSQAPAIMAPESTYPMDVAPLIDGSYPVEQIFVDPVPEVMPPGVPMNQPVPMSNVYQDSAVQQVSYEQRAYDQPAQLQAAPQQTTQPETIQIQASPTQAGPMPARDEFTAPVSRIESIQAAPVAPARQAERPTISGNLDWEKFGMTEPDRSSGTQVQIRTNQ